MKTSLVSLLAKAVLLLIALIISNSGIQAQTKIIALKSHSGQMRALEFSGTDNFGLPSQTIKTITLLSDTSVVISYTTRYYQNDTVYHHLYCNNPEISLDSLKKIYPEVSFIGFEKKDFKKPVSTPEKKRKKGSLFEWLIPGASGNTNGGRPLEAFILCLTVILAFLIYRAQDRTSKPVTEKS
jgi:hypothetical protein